MAEDNRIKIRELPAGDVSGSDTIAVAKNNIEKTVQASLTDAVRAGMTIEAGPGITVTQTSTGIKISGTAEFDDTNIQSNLSDLQAQINALKNADTGASVKAQQSPPGGSANGDLWWDTNTASMYIRYNNAWVQTNGGGGGGGGSADIAGSEAPGIVSPNESFKVGHSGLMTLNSTIQVPAMSQDRNNDGIEDRERWQANKAYFKGQHFLGPDGTDRDPVQGGLTKNLLYIANDHYTSTSNFINDVNAGKIKHITIVSAAEGGQINLQNPDGTSYALDTYKDLSNYYGRGADKTYMRMHNNTATGVQLLFDLTATGGAFLLEPGQPLVPWSFGGGTSEGGISWGNVGTLAYTATATSIAYAKWNVNRGRGATGGRWDIRQKGYTFSDIRKVFGDEQPDIVTIEYKTTGDKRQTPFAFPSTGPDVGINAEDMSDSREYVAIASDDSQYTISFSAIPVHETYSKTTPSTGHARSRATTTRSATPQSVTVNLFRM